LLEASLIKDGFKELCSFKFKYTKLRKLNDLAWTIIPFENVDFNESEWQETVVNSKHKDKSPQKFYISKKNENIVRLVDTNKKQWKLAFKINGQFDLLDHIFSYDTDTVEELHD